ncbi:alpha/beta fold hydrolase [Fusibacter sp. 3D3]|uniref:intracellular short-chain-length polyhydroxyalkanoate depolymerase n=1 Tax=Fusibacter sp. 3D3 TaxID=1048380 RepID=UPI0009FE1DE0|nr:alpha/beta hydrolase [Fusibacter sp. 3D3]
MEFKKMQVGNEILAYRECGEGARTLLLIHGNMSSSLHFDHLMNALSDEFKIYAPDLRGFGHSSYHESFDSLKALSEDLEYFVDKLRLKDIELVGWSTGGGIAMQFAADNPGLVKRLVLLESVGASGYPMYFKDEKGHPDLSRPLMTKSEIASDPVQVAPVLEALSKGDSAFYRALWDAAIYTGAKKPDVEDYVRYITEMLLQRNLVDIDYALSRFNITDLENAYGKGTGDVKKIKCPVIVVQGEKDIVVPMAMAEEILAQLKCEKTLKVLKNSGHNPMVDQLDKVKSIIIGQKQSDESCL